MRIPIESGEPSSNHTDWPAAEPGTYHMKIRRWDQDKKTRNGTKDVVEFVGEHQGQTVGANLWISGPGKRADGSTTKGNLWQYRRLAEALGQAAIEQYRTPLSDGGSSFRPDDWGATYVKVTVGQYGVDSVEEADLEVAKRLTANDEPQAPTKPQTHTAVADDDIPF